MTNSTANPGYAASEDLWMYYQTVQTTLQNLRLRWAQNAIRYDESSAQKPKLTSAILEDCLTGVYLNLSEADTLSLTSVTSCNVATPVYIYNGVGVTGSITHDCGVVSVAMVNDPNRDSSGLDTNKNSQSECSFILPDSSTVVAVFWNTHLSKYGLGSIDSFGTAIPSPRCIGWSTSGDGGASFTDRGPILPASANGAPNPTVGDAGDPMIAYDPGTNRVYLLANPSREAGYLGFRLWTSNDKGQTFTLINTDVPGQGRVTGADGPGIAVWSGDVYVTGGGPGAWAAHSADYGTNWDAYKLLDSNGHLVTSTIASDGTIYVFWVNEQGTEPNARNVHYYSWLAHGTTNWSTPARLGNSIHSGNKNGSGNPLRKTGGDANDFFASNAAPWPVFANGCIYVVYADLPSPGSTTDRGDIFLVEAKTNSDHSLAAPVMRKVNNDNTQTDQWNPSITVNPAGTELFIGYYSRQNDPVTNSWIMAYGAKACITNGLGKATFDCFPVSLTNFQPLFAGTNEVPQGGWAYDPVWPQTNMCLDMTYATYVTNGDDSICFGV
jgi:hypothetical protein